MRAPQLLIGTKFALILAVLVPALAAVALIGGLGMAHLNDEVTTLYRTNIRDQPGRNRARGQLRRGCPDGAALDPDSEQA